MNIINELANIAKNNYIDNSNSYRDTIVSEYTDTINSLETIDKSIIRKDIRQLPVYQIKESNIEEGYAIDLDSLKYIVKSEQITLEEAVQKIRDINYIGDTYPIYCVLKEGFNEHMTVENFCTLYKTLTESGITPVINNTISYDNFVNEGVMSDVYYLGSLKPNDASKAIVGKNMAANSIDKRITNLNNELETYNKLSKEEKEKYIKKMNASAFKYSVGQAALYGMVGQMMVDKVMDKYNLAPSTITTSSYPTSLKRVIRNAEEYRKRL